MFSVRTYGARISLILRSLSLLTPRMSSCSFFGDGLHGVSGRVCLLRICVSVISDDVLCHGGAFLCARYCDVLLSFDAVLVSLLFSDDALRFSELYGGDDVCRAYVREHSTNVFLFCRRELPRFC